MLAFAGTANNSTVSNGGQVDLYRGAPANGLVAEAGGSVNIMANGVKTVDSLALNGGRLVFARVAMVRSRPSPSTPCPATAAY